MTPPYRRAVAGVLALALLYWAAARLGLLLAFQHSNASPVWPPSGIALAALALGGPRMAAGVALGAFAANLQLFVAHHAIPLPTLVSLSAVIALGNTLEARLAATAWQRWRSGGDEPFARLDDVAKFVGVAALSSVIAAAVGAFALLGSGVVSRGDGVTVALTWWLGDFAGMLLVAPLLLAWHGVALDLRRAAEPAASLALLAALAAAVFGWAEPAQRWTVALFIPALAWAAWRFGSRGASAAVLLVAGIAVVCTTQGRGPFAGGVLNDALLQLGIFVVLCAVAGLVFAADRSERLRLGRALRADSHAPWAVLVGGFALAVGGWHLFAAQAQAQAAERFDAQAGRIERRIANRIADYEQTLHGAAGLFAASRDVTRHEWRAYVQRLDIEQRLPGIQGLGYARVLAADELDAVRDAMHADGFDDFALRPSAAAQPRDRYSAIVFIEPFNERNRRAFGYDMLSEPVRRHAMERAGDTGRVALSAKVTLVQDSEAGAQPGMLMYLPVYRNGAVADDPAQRRAALVGYVYAPFRMAHLMRSVLGDDLGGLALSLHDGDEETPDTLMYRSAGFEQADRPLHALQRALPLPGRTWTLHIVSTPAFDAAGERQKALFVLVAGIVISLLLFALVRSLTLTRERAQELADGMTAALRDSERAAREAERQLRALMNASPAGVVFTKAGGRIVYANPSYLRIAGLDEASKGELRTLHPADHARVRDEWLAATREAAPFESRFRYRHDDGRIVWAHARSAALLDGDAVLGHVAIVEDVSERVAADAALAARTDALQRSNRELEQFAYVASHDLQEPLRTVASYSQLLLRRHRAAIGPEAQEFLDFIGDGARRAQALIGDLLALARVDSTARPFAPVALADVLDDAQRALRGALRDAGASVTHDEALPVLHGDRVQLAQLLQNLIGNALKFRGAAAPRVHVAARRDGAQWCVEVRDNGIGIDARFHERIFTLFQRLHSRDEYAGTGIGLAICKKVVERHGGAIGVRSAPGAGSTFFFTIPAGPEEGAEAVHAAQPSTT